MPEGKTEAPAHQLKVLIDPTGHKMAQKLFETYVIGEEAKRKKKDNAAYKRMPEFCLALDRLVEEFGGKPIPEDEPIEGGNPGSEQEDLGYDVDDNIHEGASLDRVKQAIARIIRG